MSTTEISYRTGNELDLGQMIELYRASTLGERRPIDNRETMRAMLQNANLIVTAWEGPLLVGIARSMTDFAYVAYLSDLAVRLSHQRSGIGRELISHTKAALGPEASIVLLAAPKANDYYPRIGFTHHPRAWWLQGHEPLK